MTNNIIPTFYHPPGSYLYDTTIYPQDNDLFTGIYNFSKIISDANFVGTGNQWELIAHSNVGWSNLYFTNAHTKNINACIKLKSDPRKNKNILITHNVFEEGSWIQAIDGPNGANMDSTHWYENVVITYNTFNQLYQTGRQVITVDPVDGQQSRAINLEQMILTCDIGWNSITYTSGEGIFSGGSNTGLQTNIRNGTYNVHDNYCYRNLMSYEVASGLLYHNVHVWNNKFFYPTLNGGFAISGNSNGGEWDHNVLKVANRSAWEGVYTNSKIHDNIVYMDAWRDTSMGEKNTIVTNQKSSFLQYYGSGNKIYGNDVYQNRTGADNMTPAFMCGITFIGKASGGDTALNVNKTYLNYTDYPVFAIIHDNTFTCTALYGTGYSRILDCGDTSNLPFRNISFYANTIITDANNTPMMLKGFNPYIGENTWYMNNPPASGQAIADIDPTFLSKGKRMSGYMSKQLIFSPGTWNNKNDKPDLSVSRYRQSTYRTVKSLVMSNIAILSDNSKIDAARMFPANSRIRNRVLVNSKAQNNGTRQMTAGFDYYTVFTTEGKLPTDMLSYKNNIEARLAQIEVLPKIVTIENEIFNTRQPVNVVVNMYAAALEVLEPLGIQVTTSGTNMPAANTLTRDFLPAAQSASFAARNSVVRSATLWQQEIDAIKAGGLDAKLLYNFHWQLKDDSYYTDFSTVYECLSAITGMNIYNNEIGIDTLEGNIGQALGKCCLLFDDCGIYNMTGKGGQAKVMNDKVEHDFLTTVG